MVNEKGWDKFKADDLFRNCRIKRQFILKRFNFNVSSNWLLFIDFFGRQSKTVERFESFLGQNNGKNVTSQTEVSSVNTGI